MKRLSLNENGFGMKHALAAERIESVRILVEEKSKKRCRRQLSIIAKKISNYIYYINFEK